MNILQVISDLSRRAGGPAQAVLEVSQALVRKGHAISIFGISDAPAQKSEIARGIEIRSFPREWSFRYRYSGAFREALEHEIQKFDLVHIHGVWTYPTFAASRIAKKAEVPYILRPCGMLDAYSLSHHALRKKLYYSLIEKITLRNAAAIHFTTQEEKESASAIRNILDSKFVVVPLGLELESYTHLPPRGSIRNRVLGLENKKIILFLGRVNFKKGLDLLIRAFSKLVKERSDIHLIIAGPDDEGYGKKLDQWIRDEKIQTDVTRLGFVEGGQKLSLFSDSDIFCLPSHQENFGLAVLEAMAAGLPVLVSEHVNLSEEIGKQGAGLVTSLGIEEIAGALNKLLEDDTLRYQMGAHGKALVRREYSWDLISEWWIRLYEDVSLQVVTRLMPEPV